MLKKFINKAIAPIILFVICFCSLSLTVYAASDTYNSTLEFWGEHTGATRSYTHSNISYSATARSYVGNTQVSSSNTNYSKTYKVSLYRKTGLFSSEKVGSADLSRYTSGSAKWTNVGSGDYYFYFTKARDGVTVKSTNVVMKGY